jgi:UDP-4-amino-4,6-dideoxy-N-acetyl-beta-L-altrosamine N-acetyltransferase
MIELRDIEDDDLERLFAWRNEPEVDRWMYSHPPSLEQHRAWFAAFRADPDRKGFIITLDGRPCGSLTLTGLTSAQRRARWDWYIGDAEARGRGAGRAAQALGLDMAFGRYGLQRVWAEVLADNEVALRAQAAAGFRREGYLRRHAYKHGEFRDVALLAILEAEWAARRTAVLKDLTASGLIGGAAAVKVA